MKTKRPRKRSMIGRVRLLSLYLGREKEMCSGLFKALTEERVKIGELNAELLSAKKSLRLVTDERDELTRERDELREVKNDSKLIIQAFQATILKAMMGHKP